MTAFKRTILFLFVWVSLFNANGQNQPIHFVGYYFTTDQTGCYYEINTNSINKFDKSGQLLYTFSNNLLGEISDVDVSNPMKILVFFKDFSKIIILDNTLSERGSLVDLNEISLEETSLVCSSYNNGIWYYNPLKFQLSRIENTAITNSSANLSTILNVNLLPNFLTESNNKVFLNDPVHGVLVFDIYGTYIKTISIVGLSTFQAKEKYLLYVNSNGQIETYDFFSLKKTVYKPLEFTNIKSVRIENNTIYIINSNNQLFIDRIDI